MIKPYDDGNQEMPKHKKRGKKLKPDSKSKIKYRKQFLEDWMEEDDLDNFPGFQDEDDETDDEDQG